MKCGVIVAVVLLSCFSVRGMGRWPDSHSGGKALVTLRVVDETGDPVPSAMAHGYFWDPRAKDYAGSMFHASTDRQGLTTVKGRAFTFLEVAVLCERHYTTDFRVDYPGSPKGEFPQSWRDWVATNTVVLKRVRNPVPMYVKTATITIPGEEATVAYDLVKGDWLAPYGSGTSTDMLFQVAGEYRSFTERKVDLHVSVPGEFNGLLVSREPLTWNRRPTSELRSAHEAPTEGYSYTWAYRTSRSGNTVVNPSVTDSGVVFYFRIRSEFDELGELRRALYGKIYGHIMADHDEYLPNRPRNVMIQFTYYLNPDGTRNVEFDPDQNLFRLTDRRGNPLRFAP